MTSDNPEEQRRTRLESIRHMIRQGELEKAIVACDMLNEDFPDFDAGWHIASHLALQANSPAAALRAIDIAVVLSPEKPEWLLQKINCLHQLGKIGDARKLALLLLRAPVDDASVVTSVARTLTRLGLHESALTQFRRAAQLQPDDGTHHYNLAEAQQRAGRYTEAEASLDKAIELNPRDYVSLALRSSLRLQTAGSNHVDELEHLLTGDFADPRDEAKVCYVLAQEYEDLGQAQKSFGYRARGARLRRSTMQYDVSREVATMTSIQQAYTQDFMGSDIAGCPDPQPIFIIGLPCTGTALLERIIHRHSVVRPSGERGNFSVAMMAQCRRLVGGREISRHELAELSKQLNFAELGRAYLNSARPPGSGHAHFVDKLPFNFLYVGLMHLALPKAKIIRMTRHPVDACYAMFKTLFVEAYPYSYDLEELGIYYSAYQKLVAHWESLIPDAIHNVSYEQLVSDAGPVIRTVLDFCDLSWQEQCVDFFRRPAAATNDNDRDFRREAYQSTVGRWRLYEKQLKPLIAVLTEGLGPLQKDVSL